MLEHLQHMNTSIASYKCTNSLSGPMETNGEEEYGGQNGWENNQRVLTNNIINLIVLYDLSKG